MNSRLPTSIVILTAPQWDQADWNKETIARLSLIRFRHFTGGSLALASLNLACRDLVPAFPQRSPAELGFGGVDPEATGRPSYHPSILLKLYIYGYLNRVKSKSAA